MIFNNTAPKNLFKCQLTNKSKRTAGGKDGSSGCSMPKGDFLQMYLEMVIAPELRGKIPMELKKQKKTSIRLEKP